MKYESTYQLAQIMHGPRWLWVPLNPHGVVSADSEIARLKFENEILRETTYSNSMIETLHHRSNVISGYLFSNVTAPAIKDIIKRSGVNWFYVHKGNVTIEEDGMFKYHPSIAVRVSNKKIGFGPKNPLPTGTRFRVAVGLMTLATVELQSNIWQPLQPLYPLSNGFNPSDVQRSGLC